jgi:hypothetical protein
MLLCPGIPSLYILGGQKLWRGIGNLHAFIFSASQIPLFVHLKLFFLCSVRIRSSPRTPSFLTGPLGNFFSSLKLIFVMLSNVCFSTLTILHNSHFTHSVGPGHPWHSRPASRLQLSKLTGHGPQIRSGPILTPVAGTPPFLGFSHQFSHVCRVWGA